MLVARFRMLRSASQGAMRQQRQQRTQSVKEIRKNQENKAVASDVFGQWFLIFLLPLLSIVDEDIGQADDAKKSSSRPHEFPRRLSFFVFVSIVLISSLSFVAFIVGFWFFYFLVVFFEHFEGKVEFVVDWVFPFKVLVESINEGVDDWLLAGLAWRRVFSLMLSSFGGVWQNFVAGLNFSKGLDRCWIFGEIGVMFFDKFEIASFELFFGEVVGEVEQFEIVCFFTKAKALSRD